MRLRKSNIEISFSSSERFSAVFDSMASGRREYESILEVVQREEPPVWIVLSVGKNWGYVARVSAIVTIEFQEAQE